ncbi:MAG TPA: copper amine oxidase N-terminal domain-containing protein [Clostridiaceae bacterium]|nr:copper amine oxidase N-terminal domain-containing protein [Clostridiaceae bacterium]
MKRKLVLTVVLLVMILSSVLPAYGLNEDDFKTVIKLKPGSGTIAINGKSYSAESPFVEGGTLFVPLRLILEAFGAEVNWQGNNKVNIIYGDYSFDLTVGDRKYFVNQDEKQFDTPPRYKKDKIMIPLSFIEEYFDVSVSKDEQTGTVTVILEDDGALTDLSFLIGSISESKIGDSYYGWSIDVPRGSRVGFITFNSKYIYVENDQRDIGIEVYIDTNVEGSLKDYYEKVSDSPMDFMDGIMVDCTLNSDKNPQYVEILYINDYEEAAIQRLYTNNRYLYKVVLTSYSETEPENIIDNKFFISLLNSFRLGYKGFEDGVQDLSKVEFGMAKYENYITDDSYRKHFSWEMKLPPEWDEMDTHSDNPYVTRLGKNEKEYVVVELAAVESEFKMDEFITKLLDYYKGNFNEKCYEFQRSGKSSVGGRESHNIVYKLVNGMNTYVVEENFLVAGDLLYNITIKSPEDKYKLQKTTYNKILESFSYSSKEQSSLKDGLKKYSYASNRNRVGKNDDISKYINNEYEWKIELAGYWTKGSELDSSVQTFYNDRTGAIILIEAVENEDFSKTADDKAKFAFLSNIISQDVELKNEGSLTFKGHKVKTYTYRMEDEEEDIYMDFQVYVMNTGTYSYCYISAISDLYASEKNLKEMQEIWNSFTPALKKD